MTLVVILQQTIKNRVLSMRTKTCSVCGEEKMQVYFYKRADSNDGYRAECIDCKKKESYENYAFNRDMIMKRRNYLKAQKEKNNE